MNGELEFPDVVNLQHPYNRGLIAQYAVLPNRAWGGGLTWRNVLNPARYPGTLTNGPTWSGDSPFGGSLKFAGSTDHVRLPVLNPGSDPWAMAMWFRTTSNGVFLAGEVNTSGNRSFVEMGLGASTSHRLECFMGDNVGGIQSATSTRTADDGQWHFGMIGRRNDNKLFCALDGELPVISSTAFAGPTSASPVAMYVGARNVDGSASTSIVGNIAHFTWWQGVDLSAQTAVIYRESRLGYPNLWNWRKATRYVTVPATGAPPGLSIPIAAYHYNYHLKA